MGWLMSFGPWLDHENSVMGWLMSVGPFLTKGLHTGQPKDNFPSTDGQTARSGRGLATSGGKHRVEPEIESQARNMIEQVKYPYKRQQSSCKHGPTHET